VFHRPEKGFNIDETNEDKESALHLCARRGDAQRVELLVMSGADLALQNSTGNTPLHVVVEESATEPSMEEAFLEVCILVTVAHVSLYRLRTLLYFNIFACFSVHRFFDVHEPTFAKLSHTTRYLLNPCEMFLNLGAETIFNNLRT